MIDRDEILQEAVNGREVPEWIAKHTKRLYRELIEAGAPHADAIAMAQQEMVDIMNEAERTRRAQKWEEAWKDHIAPWLVVIGGAALCVWWYVIWL